MSCDRSVCESDNDIFNTHEPNTKIYKDELVKQLKLVDSDQLSYWLKSYNNVDYIRHKLTWFKVKKNDWGKIRLKYK